MIKKLTSILYFVTIITLLTSLNLSANTNNDSEHHIENTSQSNFHQQLLNSTTKIDSNNKQLSEQDLARFAQQLGDARIVGLGEQTHGEGSVFTLKTQLVKYLHEKHDFDVFILESGMFDVQQIWLQALHGQKIKSLAANNIFYMYSKTAEVMPLFDYINAQLVTDNPLILVGFDSQHSGGIANKHLVDSLKTAVAQSSNDISKLVQWQVLTDQIQQVLDLRQVRFCEAAETLFFQQLHNLQQVFLTDSQSRNDESGFWYRITKGLEAQAKRQWQITDTRSKEMGENIKYWAAKYPDKKILIWAHTWHLTRDGNYQVNAGQVVAEKFGDEYFISHFTGAAGEYTDYVSMKNVAIPLASHNSLETFLNINVVSNVAFLNTRALSEASKNQQMSVYSSDYEQTLPANQWSKYFDGIFFIKEIKAANFKN